MTRTSGDPYAPLPATAPPPVRAARAPAQIAVLVAADLRLLRDWLVRDLAAASDLIVLGTAPTGAEAVSLARRLKPALLLVHRGMPDSLTAVREVLAALPRVRVLAFDVQETEPEIAVCSDAGIHGFIPRDASRAILVECVRRALGGEFVGSAAVSALLLRHFARRTSPLAGRGLTGREVEILRHIELGHTNKEIAAAVGIEVATVKNHVHRVLRKLEVHRRTEAAAKWRRCGRGLTTGWVARRSG